MSHACRTEGHAARLTVCAFSPHSFQKALKEYGVSDVDVFQTVDLWEKNKDFPSVINCLFALGREVRSKLNNLSMRENLFSSER